MTEIRRVWGVVGFRNQLKELVELPSNARQRLFDYVAAADSDEEFLVDPLDDSEARLLPLVDMLFRIASDSGADSLVADLAVLERSLNTEIVDAIQPHLAVERDVDPDVALRRASLTALPALERSEVFLDLRLVTGDREFLAPVAIVRLALDEPYAGSDAVVFQAPLVELVRLRDQLSEYLQAQERIVSQLPSGLVVQGHDEAGR